MKKYKIQIKLSKKWLTIETKNRHTDALYYVKENVGQTYPMRIVRVVETVVFESKD